MDIMNFVFSPVYTIGHLVGTIVAVLIQFLSGVVLSDTIIDTIGLLTMMTVILALADIAKKIAWGIVTICWALVIMRIGMLAMGN